MSLPRKALSTSVSRIHRSQRTLNRSNLISNEISSTLNYASRAASSSSATSEAHTQQQPAKPPPSRLLKGVARLLGYNAAHTTAVRNTNFYYNYISELHRRDFDFWYGECRLPQSFQAWFQITNLYIFLLSVRFRALDPPLGRYFLQEMINHFFIDAEYRMQSDYEIKQSRYIKTTLKTMLAQHHGSTLAYDEGLVGSDAMLAAALWRNIFGASWGGMGGVSGKKAPPSAPIESEAMAALEKPSFSHPETDTSPDSVPEKSLEIDPSLLLRKETQFATTLAKLVNFIRSEVSRLDGLSNEVVANGPTKNAPLAMEFARLSTAD